MSRSTRAQPSLPNSFVISVAHREGCALQRQVKDCTRFCILPPPTDSSRAGNRDPGPVQCTLNRDAFPVYNPVPHGYSSKSITNTKVAREGHGRPRNSSLRPKMIYSKWHSWNAHRLCQLAWHRQVKRVGRLPTTRERLSTFQRLEQSASKWERRSKVQEAWWLSELVMRKGPGESSMVLSFHEQCQCCNSSKGTNSSKGEAKRPSMCNTMVGRGQENPQHHI